MRPSRPIPSSSLVEYGVIGDLHSAALVSRHGSLDWLCLPRFDSPSIFAGLLDTDRGGRFAIRPAEPYESTQRYDGETNVLRTEFRTPTGAAALIDFMPVEEIDTEEYAFQEVHRILEVVEGEVAGTAEFAPRFNYARSEARLTRAPMGIFAVWGRDELVLSADLPFELQDNAAFAEWSLRAGDRRRFVLRYGTDYVRPTDAYLTFAKHAAVKDFWQRWVGRSTYKGRWRSAVIRSALALKLLTYAPTGALVAAATTSLPETPGGGRNWDYRLSWVRDSAYAMQAFHALGFTREARRYLRWLRRLLRGLTRDVGELRVCYGLEGETDLVEEELPHLRGYLDSRPVRIGNAALEQVQHDIYGSLVDAMFEAYRLPEGFPDEAWRTVRAIAEHVCKSWQTPDHGIWEVRGPRRRYTHSAVMSWVALDRAVRIAQTRGQSEYEQRWGRERDRIRGTVLDEAWNESMGSFTQALGSDSVDAALLVMPLVGFLRPTDPRVIGTIDRIQRDLTDGPFVHRYRVDDGLQGTEGAFLLCSFWMTHALALAGRLEQAENHFEALGRLAGSLGLFSEEVDVATRRALGNFPQALTHLAHILTALALDAPQQPQPGKQ